MDRKKKTHRKVCKIVFIVYLAFLMYFLFFSDYFGRTVVHDEYRYNFEPFKEIDRYWNIVREKNWQMFLVNIIGNVVLFVPFGYLYTVIIDRKHRYWFLGLVDTVFVSLIFVLVVETCQLVSKVGVFDIDDIILNVSGTVLGYLVYSVVHIRYLKNMYKGQKKNEKTG